MTALALRLWQIFKVGFWIMFFWFIARVFIADVVPMSWQIKYESVEFIPHSDIGPSVRVTREVRWPWVEIPIMRYVELHRFDRERMYNLCTFVLDTIAEDAPENHVDFNIDVFLGPLCSISDQTHEGPYELQVTYRVNRFMGIYKLKTFKVGPLYVRNGAIVQARWLEPPV